ncbi:MAG: efflux RND transporter periplasmic adaptor subunit [Cyanothece sp. SIO1E1]|nr:efflux RND transporter periplasmic adaptor subunit [Cyanothece sp. SIO1E1]
MSQRQRCLTFTFTFLLLTALVPAAAFAHGGHGDEFSDQASTSPEGIEVDGEAAKQIGVRLQPVTRQFLDTGIKTTGQIENQPGKRAEVRAPIPGTVVELLAEPGESVSQGQPVAVISSPELVQLRVEALDRGTEADAALEEALANLKLAQQTLERQRQIATTAIAAARTQLAVAEERYDRDQKLLERGAIPRRQMLDSEAQLAETRTVLETATSRREVLAAEAELKRAETAVNAARTRVKLSDTTYQTRLQQLGTPANDKGLVTVLAPIAGTVASQVVTLGESFEDTGGQLMTIVNNAQVWATANIYEKDLEQVRMGQPVRVRVDSLPGETFMGKIAQIDPVVAGETRAVPVRAQLDNSSRQLKPGMFAQLEVLTGRTPVATLAVPSRALVEANGKQVVYVQNGRNLYQPVDVTLGATLGDWVEVKKGLFEGDQLVVEGGVMLYAQSLRGGSEAETDDHGAESPSQRLGLNPRTWPGWLVIPAGGAIATSAFFLGRRTRRPFVPAPAGPTYDSMPNNHPLTTDSRQNGSNHRDPDPPSPVPDISPKESARET